MQSTTGNASSRFGPRHGVLVWAIAAVFGMGALLARVAWLYRALEMGRGLYLLYIGVHSYRYARVPMAIRATNAVEVHSSSRQAFRRGFSTNFADLKVLVFFASIFSAILKLGTPLWVRLAAITIIFFNDIAFGLITFYAPCPTRIYPLEVCYW
ncbi:LysE family transporter [Acidipila sp. EB88]|uniref:LysE family transporter n=1 Tax=Acidipila sp. EB88 TaxID=2305226 RepID=UPI000F5FF4B4|nr:LysE family transporter [Acidipila sp. EB88]RRA47668.1 hypothetical protein D1Y84_04545 [Acidipila sp. EB88]